MGRGPYDGMPTVNARLSARVNQKSVAFSIAEVQATRVHEGRVYVDAEDPTTAQFYKDCPLMSFGGASNCVVYFPIQELPVGDELDEVTGLPVGSDAGQAAVDTGLYKQYPHEVLLLHRDGGKPYAIGMAQHPRYQIQEKVADSPGAADHNIEIGKNDIGFRNKGAAFIMDDNGAITFSAFGDRRVRLQLQHDGVLRISRRESEAILAEGAATERFLLSEPVRSWMSRIEDIQQEQNSRLAEIEDRLEILDAALAGGILVAANPAVGGALTTTPIPLGIGGTGLYIAPTSELSIPENGPSMVSSTIEVSDKAEG